MDIPSLFSLDGRVALVTGGSRGIGRMITEGLLCQGARVYITARKAEACEATAAELSEQYGPGRCVALPVDVSTTDGIAALLEAFRTHEDHLDILVNNAGAAWGALVIVAIPPLISLLRDRLPGDWARASGLELLLFGAVIVAVVLLRPAGLAGGGQSKER